MRRIIDLSAPIENTSPDAPAFLRVTIEYSDHQAGAREFEQLFGIDRALLRNGEGPATETITFLSTHSTTHLDAPWHYNSVVAGEPAPTIDQLPLEWFFAPGVKLDFRWKADGDAVTVADLERELARIGHTLAPGEIVLVETGRDAYYGAPDYWLRGPGVTAEATRWLFAQGIRVMGIDAWSWDRPLHLAAREALERQEPGILWAAHQADLPYVQIERLWNLAALPLVGFTVACFPLRIVRGSAAPARVVAILE